MNKFIYYILISGIATISPCQDAKALTCTAAPSCDELGYINTNCPKGGIKCPFDQNKMFCIRDGVASEYKFVNSISRYQIAYSDGTTGKFYADGKLPIGIVTYVHPTKTRKHGLIMSIKNFTVQDQAMAHHICETYATGGTQAGDWHLPDIGEIATMSTGDTVESSADYNSLLDVLKIIPDAGYLGQSYSFYYGNSLITTGVDKAISTNSQGSFLSHAFTYSGRGTYWYSGVNFVSDSQPVDTSSNAYYSILSNTNDLSTIAKTKKMQFRCVAYF